jgi:hypothetical protein
MLNNKAPCFLYHLPTIKYALHEQAPNQHRIPQDRYYKDKIDSYLIKLYQASVSYTPTSNLILIHLLSNQLTIIIPVS